MSIFNDIIDGKLDNDFQPIVESENIEDSVIMEAVYPDKIPYIRTVNKKITLPQGKPIGKGNVCFLYTKSLKDSINLINDKTNCLSTKYKAYYYNRMYYGKIYNKRYKINHIEEQRNIYKKVEKETKCICRKSLDQYNTFNLFYDLYKYLDIFETICSPLQPMKYIKLYWEYMDKILNSSFEGYTNKFVLVNLAQFKLTGDLKLDLKNPLYIIYYTLYKKPDLIKNINIDYYMYLGNKVMKINPREFIKESLKMTQKEDVVTAFAHGGPLGIAANTTATELNKKSRLNGKEPILTPEENDELKKKVDKVDAASDIIRTGSGLATAARLGGGLGAATAAGTVTLYALDDKIDNVSDNMAQRRIEKIDNKAIQAMKQEAKKKTTLLKTEMRKLYPPTQSKQVDIVTSPKNIKKEDIVQSSIDRLASIMEPIEDDKIIVNDSELKTLQNKTNVARKEIEKKVKDVAATDLVDDDEDDTPEVISDNDDTTPETPEKDTTDDDKTNESEFIKLKAQKELDEDRELIEKIYYQTKSNLPKKSEASTARDKMLLEKQKDIMVNNMTIADIEKIKANNIPIPTTDVSKTLKTTNKNLAEIKYNNIDATYNKKVMTKDITNAILSLNDKSIPMFIRDIKIEDTSNELNYKDTYTILLEDGNRKRHTVKVDIPKFYEDKFLYLGGHQKILKHQNFFFPVVKIKENWVQIISNYSKMTLERVDNKSLSAIERLKKLVSKSSELSKYFTPGAAYPNNKDFITSVEYDDLSKVYLDFKIGTGANQTYLMFDQREATEFMKSHKISEKKGYFFIGKQKGESIFIDVNKQTTADGRTIVDVILDSLPDTLVDEFGAIRAPKRLMYAKVKLMAQFVSVGLILGFWEGLSTLCKKLKLDYRLEKSIPKDLKPNENFLKFSDCIMVYSEDVPTSLIMNGFKLFDTSKYPIAEFDSKIPYLDYIKKVYGKAIIENALMNFYEFMIDNITLEILIDRGLPTDIVSLVIYAVNLISDSQYIPEINQNLSRIRCGEVIPAILYKQLSDAYVTYRNYNGKKKFSLKQDSVIQELLKLTTVEDYSTLNPYLEMNQLHSVSSKGFKGVNLEEAYTVPKRSYDKSMTGIISPGSSPDATVGVNKTMSLEPNITNVRGYTKDSSDKLSELKDVNLFSPAELSMPLAAYTDDPTRLGHAVKQSSHVVPVTDSSPVLISNGFEETARFYLSSSFAINADEDGEVIDYNEESNILMVKYKSGKHRAIELEPKIVKNGGGGFYLSNKLITNLKVGNKFKKNDVLAYHKDFFKNSKYNNCRMTVGTLCKVALMSTYNTYNDATFITHKFSERAATEMCFCAAEVVGKNSNVFYIAKKGQEIKVGEPLIEFDTSYDDSSINALLSTLDDSTKRDIIENSRNVKKSKYSGVIEDIKIYPTVDLDEMNPTLKKIVSKYYRDINKKKEYLNKYAESKDSIIKCGVLCNEASHKITPNKYGVIKGMKAEDGVLIEFYIKHAEPLEIGSKIANYSALKNTIEEIVPEGYEPYSEYRPDEEISTFIASNSILKRMTPSIIVVSLGNKCIIELKRHLKEIYPDRKKMEDMIYSFFSAIDKSGTNAKKYKALFSPMTDAQFKSYFKGFFEDKDAYLVLDVVDYEHTVTLKDIEKAAKVLKVPLFENVYTPHLSMDKSKVICTKEPVPVGYLNIKRTQQTVMKKNGLSTNISKRSALTGQVTGSDKNGRESDVENAMLVAMGLKYALKELNGPRADDTVMKQEMLRDIALNGYAKLEDMTDEIQNKTTLNTVDTYFRGMGLFTDLVTKGLMLPKTLDEELR